MSDSLGGSWGGWLKDPAKVPLIMGLLGGLGGLGAGMARGNGAAPQMTSQGIMQGMQSGQAFGDMQQDQMIQGALSAPDGAPLTPQQQAIRQALPQQMRQLAPVLGPQATRQALTAMLTREQPETWQSLSPEQARALGLPEGGAYERSSRGQTRQVARQPDWMNPQYQALRDQWARAGRTSVSVNMPPAERAYATALGGDLAGEAKSIRESGTRAAQRLDVLNRLERLNESIRTGPAMPAGTTIGALAAQFGIPDSALEQFGLDRNTVASAEAFRSMANQLTLQAAGGSLGAQVSNRDAQIIEQINPSLANSPEGNAAVIDVQRDLARRDQAIAQSLREFQARNGATNESHLRWQQEVLPQLMQRDWISDRARANLQRAQQAADEARRGGAGRAQREIVPPPAEGGAGAPAGPVLNYDPRTGRIGR